MPEAGLLPGSACEAPSAAPLLVVRDLGRMRFAEACAVQESLAAERKAGTVADHLLFVEHPHVITLGRNARRSNILAPPEVLAHAGVEVHETNRGGDVTYHGPGQVVGYPIFDLREWKRDVLAYVRALEEVIILTLRDFGISGERSHGETGVWVRGAKVAAIGVHLSRWVASHGFAVNVDTDLTYFRHIVPCGLTKPVTSMRALGSTAATPQVKESLRRRFGEVFSRCVVEHEIAEESSKENERNV